MTQPEALRLADALEDDLHADDGTTLGLYSQGIADNAAAELRRLQALLEAEQALHQRVTYPELQRLRAQRDALLKALRELLVDAEFLGWDTAKARAAIKAVEEGK